MNKATILREIQGKFNDICIYSGVDVGRLIGLVETDEDFYYLIKNIHGTDLYCSCTGFIESLKSLPKYSAMNKLYLENCPKEDQIILKCLPEPKLDQ